MRLHIPWTQKSRSHAWGGIYKKEPDGEERRSEFNKAQQGRKDCALTEWRFTLSPRPFTTSAYLNTFTPQPFISGWLHGEKERDREKEKRLRRREWGKRGIVEIFLFECWPRVVTICANCRILWLFPAACKMSEEALKFDGVACRLSCKRFPWSPSPPMSIICSVSSLLDWLYTHHFFHFFPFSHNTWFIYSSTPARFFSLLSRWHLLLLFSFQGVINLLFLASRKASY